MSVRHASSRKTTDRELLALSRTAASAQNPSPRLRVAASPRRSSARRGTVMVMVIALLAMLFIMGTTQLMVARFERKVVDEKSSSVDAKDAAQSSAVPTAAASAQDPVGVDSVAYNGGWGNDIGVGQNSADFLGLAPLLSGMNVSQQIMRSGDLMLASLEPYEVSTHNWQYFSLSWSKNQPVDIDGSGALDANLNERPFDTVEFSLANLNQAPRDSTGVFADADGDGMLDARFVGTMSGCDIFQRVIPHGGMVTLDRMTHPALLAQVIHPADGDYYAQPWTLFNSWNGTAETATAKEFRTKDEGRLRRRFMLGGSVTLDSTEWSNLPAGDLRRLLPYTLGYRMPGSSFSSAYASHYWRFGAPPPAILAQHVTADTDRAFWEARMRPDKAPTESGYSASNDLYDRQHLITTANNDDLLRPVRDEKLLLNYPNATGDTLLAIQQLYYILNPTETDTVVNTVHTRPNEAYGMVYDASSSSWSLMFNKENMRVPFSLRDVLNRSAGVGVQTDIGRAMQLTAFYLGMIQHTSLTEGATDPLLALRTAAQLAVNTIDYADSDIPHTPTLFAYSAPSGTSPVVQVVGMEKQPYLTEAYAKVVKVYLPGPPVEIKVDPDKCVYGVEIYNPYPDPLDLTTYTLNDQALTTTLVTADDNPWNGQIAAHSYLLFVNRKDDPSENGDGAGGLVPDNYPFTDTTAAIQASMVVLPALDLHTTNHVDLKRTVTGMNVLANSAATTLTDVMVDHMENTSVNNVVLASEPVDPTDSFRTTVRHTSLQRHKERDPAHPITWHFTMALQKGWQSFTPGSNPTAEDDSPEKFVPTNYHKLFFTMNVAGGSNFKDSETLCNDNDAGACPPETAARFHNLPPMPIIVADSGLDQTTTLSPTGCAAFPTTGSLLLVTMNGHTSYYGNDISGLSLSGATATDTTNRFRLDVNHLPLWNESQVCKDIDLNSTYGNLPQGQFDMPWGQLAFSYFTALPLEELNLAVFRNAATEYDYQNQYIEYYGNATLGFSLYPMVQRATEAGSLYGSRVHGRVNINFAPWFVLDGLPVLPDHLAGANQPITGAPVQDVLTTNLDPNWSGAPAWPSDPRSSLVNAGQRPGQYFQLMLTNDLNGNGTASTSVQLPTISAEFAQYMVAYREKRNVNQADTDELIYHSPEERYASSPGYLTPGALCSLVERIPVRATVPGTNTSLAAKTLVELRAEYDTNDAAMPLNARRRPFAYLGYLQLIAPIVRLEDWVTVKTHVYTMYNLVYDGQEKYLRSQVTMDRTRCLYTNDLPDRITQADPIEYFNVVLDQQ